MIDTIVIRINNVSAYPVTKLRFEHTSKTGQTIVQISEDTGEVFSSSEVRALLHHDTDNIIPLTKRNSIHIPSSTYALTYKYNIVGDFIEFEFAIPKYLYGTNVIQFIRYFSQDARAQYDYLIAFIKSFIAKQTYEPISMRDISVRRVDFCYNQYFASRYDALKYLDNQKELLPKYARSTKNDFRNYETSLMYTTSRYSFKIYHKGTEFFKNDRKKLAEKNPTGETIPFLQDQADRMLRYEVTFRNSMFDYLFKEKAVHKGYLKFFTDDDIRGFTRKHLRKTYNEVEKFMTCRKTYVMCPVTHWEAVDTKTVHFSFEVFETLYNYFWDYVKKFQLDCKMSPYEVAKKIDEKNAIRDDVANPKLRKKLSYNKTALMPLVLLTQYYSLDELRKSNLMGKTQFYHYKKKLGELGVLSENRLVDVTPPLLGYEEYCSYFSKHHIK
jgi:hypothetical protein